MTRCIIVLVLLYLASAVFEELKSAMKLEEDVNQHQRASSTSSSLNGGKLSDGRPPPSPLVVLTRREAMKAFNEEIITKSDDYDMLMKRAVALRLGLVAYK